LHQRVICAGGDLRGVVDEQAEHARLVDAGVPECGGEIVIAPERLAERLMSRIATPIALSEGIA